MADYFAYNGPMVTTAPFVPVTTGTLTKTMLQVAASANVGLHVWKWGLTLDGAATLQVKAELMTTGTVPATVTAHVAAGIQPYGADQSASTVTVSSTTGSGYTATAEGTITATRYGDIQWIDGGTYYQNEWSLDREFFVPPGQFLRVRLTTATAVNATCWAIWDE